MTSKTKFIDVAIVGAGLSGLATADLLSRAGQNVMVFEAGDMPGGRIQSIREADTQTPIADLGPTWVWPPYQQSVAHWLDELGVRPLPQYETGNAVLDMEPGQPPRLQPLPGQHGMTRLEGGPSALIDSLLARLPKGALCTGTQITSVEQQSDGVVLKSDATAGLVVNAKRVVIAVPPRIAAASIHFEPSLEPKLVDVLSSAPTWMASQAKVVIRFKSAFWRKMGLSGRVASRIGPIVEMHDHCDASTKHPALFGFIGVPAHVRAAHPTELREAIVQQLERCFGGQGVNLKEEVVAIDIMDWAANPHITTPADTAGPGSHPGVLSAVLRQSHWNGHLSFAGAETAVNSPGLIDGALEAAERTAAEILKNVSAEAPMLQECG